MGHGLHPTNESVILRWAGQFTGQVWHFYDIFVPTPGNFFRDHFCKNTFFPIQVRHIGFSTGWGSVGEFKIWRKEDSDDNHNEAFTLGVPQNMVPGSERAAAFMIGKLFSGWMLIYSIYYYYFHHCVIYIWKKTILDHAILKRMELIYSTFCSVSNEVCLCILL